GARAGLSYVLGLFLGNAVVMGMVISGLAALVFALPGARPVLVVVSTAARLAGRRPKLRGQRSPSPSPGRCRGTNLRRKTALRGPRS
ncbi:MAG: hypothetical protein AAF679_10105, partial [Pseudomonadota bacterium]